MDLAISRPERFRRNLRNSASGEVLRVHLKAVARGRRWSLELISKQVNSVDEIARREHMDKRSVRRLLRLGFLSPRIIEAAIAEGHQPPDLTVFSLMRRVDLPLLWNAQEQALGLR